MNITTSLSPYKTLLRSLFWMLLLSVLPQTIIYIITRLNLLEPLNMVSVTAITHKFGYGPGLIMIIVFAPVVEEFMFRAYLKYEVRSISISASLLSFFLILLPGLALKVVNTYFLIAALFCSPLIFILCYRYIKKDENQSRLVYTYWSKHANTIFHFSYLLFGAAHLTNYYDITKMQIILMPLILLPYFIYGYFLGKIRIEHGLLWSIQLHILTNAFASIKLWAA